MISTQADAEAHLPGAPIHCLSNVINTAEASESVGISFMVVLGSGV